MVTPPRMFVDEVSVLFVSVCVPEIVSMSTPFARTVPAPLVMRLRYTSVSLPVTCKGTACPVAAAFCTKKFAPVAAVMASISTTLLPLVSKNPSAFRPVVVLFVKVSVVALPTSVSVVFGIVIVFAPDEPPAGVRVIVLSVILPAYERAIFPTSFDVPAVPIVRV